jgi:hypothetical protein
MNYTLIIESSDGRKSETPITKKIYVLIYFKNALAEMKEGEKISVVINKPK